MNTHKIFSFYLVLYLLFLYSTAQAGQYSHMLQSRGDVFYGFEEGTLNSGIRGIYHGRYELSQTVKIPLDIRIFGYDVSLPCVDCDECTDICPTSGRFLTEHISRPANIRFSTGADLTGEGRKNPSFAYRFRGTVFGEPQLYQRELALPWYSSEDTSYLFGGLKQRQSMGGEWIISAQTERISSLVSGQFSTTAYDYINSKKPSLNRTWQYDSQLWLFPEMYYHINSGLSLGTKALHKNELHSSDAYNLTFLYAGAQTDMVLFEDLVLFGDIYARYYDNIRMEERGYLSDAWLKPGILSHLRWYYPIRRNIFVKGNVQMDAAQKLHSLRYELALRVADQRSGRSGSVGYWAAPASLFPRFCTYADGRIGLGEQLSIIPGARAYWRWEGEDYSYYRTDVRLELDYRIQSESAAFFRELFILGGGEYQLYEETHFYSTGMNLYLGVRSYL
ncbi:MAG: hypothetical protein ACQEQ4_03825 [Fibrobacterota bacterium]